jgi:hypothetical protein
VVIMRGWIDDVFNNTELTFNMTSKAPELNGVINGTDMHVSPETKAFVSPGHHHCNWVGIQVYRSGDHAFTGSSCIIMMLQ